MFKFQNNSSLEITEEISSLLKDFISYFASQLSYNKLVTIILQSDPSNAKKVLAKTGFYDPQDFSITVYVDNRHIKDILRSVAHELVHHYQNCNNRFDSEKNNMSYEEGYAQKNNYMRELEREAFEKGNMIFRDWTDMLETNQKYLMENKITNMKNKKQVLKEGKDKSCELDGKEQELDEGFLDNSKKKLPLSKDELEASKPRFGTKDNKSGLHEPKGSFPAYLKKDKEQLKEEETEENNPLMDSNDKSSEDEETPLKEWYNGTLNEALMKRWKYSK